jgi:diamine N-acetyltransferase
LHRLVGMSDVQLAPVTGANWRECAGLNVGPDQAGYVAAVTYYLCLCAYGSTWQPLAIVRNGTVVGFCMWGVDDDGSRWIGGLVIDAAAQRTGVARSAVTALIQRFEADPDCPGVALSYSRDNTAAKNLYAALGFRETGETVDDGAEIVARRARSTSVGEAEDSR